MGLAVPPGALVGLVAQDAVDLTVPPPLGLIGRRNAVGHQPLADHPRPQSVLHAHAVDAPHDIGLGLHYLGPAVVSDAVPVGNVADRNASLLGRAPLAHRRALPEVVQLDLADGRHEAEGLHVYGVHDGFELYLVGLDDLHEGGGGVHAPAEAVRLPADDGVEAPPSGVGQHPLELGALLRPALAHLLVAGNDGQPPAFAVGFHTGSLLGDGCLVLCVLALVGDSGVYGRPVLLGLPALHLDSRHGCLLPFVARLLKFRSRSVDLPSLTLTGKSTLR